MAQMTCVEGEGRERGNGEKAGRNDGRQQQGKQGMIKKVIT